MVAQTEKRGRGRPRKSAPQVEFKGPYVWERRQQWEPASFWYERYREHPRLSAIAAAYIARFGEHDRRWREWDDSTWFSRAITEHFGARLGATIRAGFVRLYWQWIPRQFSDYQWLPGSEKQPGEKRGRGRPVGSYPLREWAAVQREGLGFEWLTDADGGYSRWQWDEERLKFRTPLVLAHPDAGYMRNWDSSGGNYHDERYMWARAVNRERLERKGLLQALAYIPDVPRWADGAVYHGADVPCGMTAADFEDEYLAAADSPDERMKFVHPALRNIRN